MGDTTSTEPQTAAENIPDTSAPQTAEPTAENRDFAAAVNLEHAEPFRRTTRQFDLGDNRRLVDMRPSNGGLDIIPEGPGVNFDNLPTLTRDDAILAVLDFDYWNDERKIAIVRQIVTATH